MPARSCNDRQARSQASCARAPGPHRRVLRDRAPPRDGRAAAHPASPETHAANALFIRSPALAALHEREYREMAARRFGSAKVYPGVAAETLEAGDEVFVDGVRIAAYFAPEYRAMDAIVRACAGARSSIHFAAFSFYDTPLGAAMIERFRAGVELRGVFYNASTGGTGSQYPPMIAAGADVRMPDAHVFPIFLHDKFIVIDYGTDDPIVITGSFNFSASAADKNDEVLYVIHDRTLADAYYATWRSLYDPAIGANRDPAGQADVVISEVYSGPAAAAVGAAPFVELWNRGATPAALAGLRLTNRRGALAPLAGLGDLGPGARVVVPFAAGAGEPLLLLDDRGRMLATFDAARYADAGRSWNRDAAAADRDATWSAAAPSPGR